MVAGIIMHQPLLFTDKEGVRHRNGEIIHRPAALDNHHRLHFTRGAIRLTYIIANRQFAGIHPPAGYFPCLQPRRS